MHCMLTMDCTQITPLRTSGYIGLAVAALLTATMLVACDVPANRTQVYGFEINAGFESVDQDINERTYSDWKLVESAIANPPSVGRVEQLRIFGDRIYIYDVADMNIRRYTMSGDLEATYGEGRGQAPGQFQNIFSFWPRGEEDVWIVDSMARTISQFRFDGTYVSSFQPDFPPARIAAVEEDRMAVLTYMQPETFAIINETGDVEKRLGSFDESISFHSPVFDGHLFPSIDGGFVWAPRFASYLFFFGKDMRLERRVQLIDRHEFPDNQVSMRQNRSAADLDHPQRTMVVSIDREYIFVNSLIRDPAPAFNVIDRYDLETAKYIDSVRIPRGGNQYQVYGGMIYGTGADTTFRAFQITFPH